MRRSLHRQLTPRAICAFLGDSSRRICNKQGQILDFFYSLCALFRRLLSARPHSKRPAPWPAYLLLLAILPSLSDALFQAALSARPIIPFFLRAKARHSNIRLTGNAYIGAISALGFRAEIVTIALSG